MWVAVETVPLADRQEYCVLRGGYFEIGTWYADGGWSCSGEEWDTNGPTSVTHVLNGEPLPPDPTS